MHPLLQNLSPGYTESARITNLKTNGILLVELFGANAKEKMHIQ